MHGALLSNFLDWTKSLTVLYLFAMFILLSFTWIHLINLFYIEHHYSVTSSHNLDQACFHALHSATPAVQEVGAVWTLTMSSNCLFERAPRCSFATFVHALTLPCDHQIAIVHCSQPASRKSLLEQSIPQALLLLGPWNPLVACLLTLSRSPSSQK